MNRRHQRMIDIEGFEVVTDFIHILVGGFEIRIELPAVPAQLHDQLIAQPIEVLPVFMCDIVSPAQLTFDEGMHREGEYS